ncbi:MAG: hypothetical protein WCX71_03345 [Candidatus Buchananbacteria bacterium]
MKRKWLNFILLLTNRIYYRKQLILKQIGLEAVFNVFILFCQEIVLSLVSLPIYLTLKPQKVTAYFADKSAYKDITFDYNLRRVLTVTGLGVVAGIWLIKLLLILFLPTVFGPLHLFSVSDFRSADIATQALVASDTAIQTARVVDSLPYPELQSVKKNSQGNYIFSGNGQPNSSVVLLLSDQQTAIYTAAVNDKGKWEVENSQKNFNLSEGNHAVIVFTFDEKQGIRSQPAPQQYFKAQSSWIDWVVGNVDNGANWSAVVIVFLGIVLTILTI